MKLPEIYTAFDLGEIVLGRSAGAYECIVGSVTAINVNFTEHDKPYITYSVKNSASGVPRSFRQDELFNDLWSAYNQK